MEYLLAEKRIVPAITHHPDAPLYKGRAPAELLAEAVDTLQRLGENSSVKAEVARQLLRQTGLVSLYFYIKYICGYNGPYEWLNDTLHLDLCNFRQGPCLTPGVKAATVISRGCGKTTIMTKPSTVWELNRNPNLRFGVSSAKEDRAQAFVDSMMQIIEENEFHQWLYPETRAAGRSRKDIVLTSRTRHFTEPNVCAITAGGSVQGFHYDVFVPDDIIGDDLLDSNRNATADLKTRTQWFWTNHRTLLASSQESRIVASMTQYDPEDPSNGIIEHTIDRWGCWDELSLEPYEGEEGWTTYYRSAIEHRLDGSAYSINPYGFSVKFIEDLLKTDPWTAYSQYINNARKSGQLEWSEYNPGEALFEAVDDELSVILPVEGKAFALSSCDVTIGLDPGASIKSLGNRTSKTALVLYARTPEDHRVVLSVKTGYVSPTTWFDWLFETKARVGHALRATVVELVAGFKALEPLIRAEECRRRIWLNFRPTSSLGQKETTIRNILQPLLARGLLYATPGARVDLLAELHSFPSRKLDVLDALKLAEYSSVRPLSGKEKDEKARRRTQSESLRSSISGY